MFGVVGALCLGAHANAEIIIPTNAGGADTEVREFEIIDNFGTTEATFQRGANTELATRGINRTTTATNDRSSVMYMKFDISSLPNHVSDPGFWADKNLAFRGFVRNTNLSDGRILDQVRAGQPLPGDQWERVKFNMLGLEPGVGRYADDDPNQANRTDRSGNAFVSPHYKYDWSEGTGTGGGGDTAEQRNSGITYVSAPGMTPFCMTAGMCGEAYGDADVNNIHKTLGVYDDFNSDARLLGEWEWPVPRNYLLGANRYPVGMPLEYTDSNGNLKQLIFDAQDAGRTKVTLMLHLGVNTLDEGSGGIFSGSDFLNFNYLFIPKEMTTLNNDNNWDPDGSGPLGGIGSPYSCNGGDGTGGTSTNCNGDGTPNGDTVLRTLGNNSAGAFSPQLIVRVPEPTSLVLLALGAVTCGAVRRRK